MIGSIVITGPSGRPVTEAARRLRDALTDIGYAVVTVPDMRMSLAQVDLAERIRRQLEAEQSAAQAAEAMPGDKKLIICEGGAMDHVPGPRCPQLRENGLSEVYLRDHYGAAFYMAEGLDDDALRKTSLPAWVGQTHLRLVRDIDQLIDEAMAFLGEPEPYEIERKYLIDYPDLTALSADLLCRAVRIVQTYVGHDEATRFRLRARGDDDGMIYFKTQKTRLTAIKSIEEEQHLTRDAYETLLKDAEDPRTLEKTRYCLVSGGSYWEIDIYPFWPHQAIMEIELRDEDQAVTTPECIHVQREVTGEKAYKNVTLAELYGR